MAKAVLPTIGWREWVELPDFGVDRIKAKVDTGARTSSLHAWDVQVVGSVMEPTVRFKVHPLQRSTRETIACEAPLVETRWVRSSNGVREKRPVIRTTIGFLDLTWEIELTLTSRDLMGFRMLLGREAIRRRFLVHPGRSFLGERQRERDKKTGKRTRA